jgi:hypothetical protein
MSFSMQNSGRLWGRLDIRQLGTLAGQNPPARAVGFKWGDRNGERKAGKRRIGAAPERS